MINSDLRIKITKTLEKKTGVNNWSLSGPEIEARECVIYRATSSKFTFDIAIKVYRKIIKNNSILQHDILKKLNDTLNINNNENFVPKVFGSFPEHGTFLMEWVNSPPLERRLWRYFYSKKRVQNDINRTYKWLKSFHDITSVENKKVDIDFYTATLNECIRNHKMSVKLLENKVFQFGKLCFENYKNNYFNFKTAHALLHGDFTPSNILIDDTKVTGIDIFGNQNLPVANDISLQLSYIAIEYPNMLTRYDFTYPPEEWPLLKVVLEAYEYPKNQEQLKFLLFVFLYQLLRRWVIIFNRNHMNNSILDRWRLRNTEMIVNHLSSILCIV